MKKTTFKKTILGILVIACISMATSAMAAETTQSKSLYKTGNAVASIGYSSLTESGFGLGINGFAFGFKYFYTDNLGIGVELNSGTVAGGPDLTNYSAMFGYHMGFNESMGIYAALGYGTTTSSAGASATGLALEVGVESKLASTVLAHLAYKRFDISTAAGAGNAAGITVGIDLVF